MNLEENNNVFSQMWTMVRRLLRLYTDNARMALAEKLTRFMSTIAISFIGLILGVCALIFITLGVGRILSQFLPEYWSFLIIGGFYLLLILVLWLLRKPLLVDPLARFLSSLIVEPPTSADNE